MKNIYISIILVSIVFLLFLGSLVFLHYKKISKEKYNKYSGHRYKQRVRRKKRYYK
jgi:cytochrome bd-type quinol oxidase subunit 1